MLLKDLIEKYNITANTAFNKGYQELDPALSSLAYKFMSGDRSSTDFPIVKIMSKIRKFFGNRVHNSPADSFFVTIKNYEYDGAVDVPRRELKRAMAANALTGLDIYTKEIGSIGAEAKDRPYEDLLDMIEAGAANTYGVCFDQQNFFDTTHAFDNVAGTQSNIVSGGGVTTDALLVADLDKAMTALRGFYYLMDDAGGNSKKRKLNRSVQITVVCPDGLAGAFERINKAEYITSGVTNVFRGMISQIISRPFTDTTDWFVFETSESNVKPFIISEEEAPKLEMPTASDYNLKEHKVMTWGLEGFSYGVAYGAWWKAIQVSNA
jgi:phage major head subunit gpT-like protein